MAHTRAVHRWCCAAVAVLFIFAVNALGIPDWAADADRTKAQARQLAAQHWKHNLHRIQSMLLDDRKFGDFLGPVMQHAYVLPQAQVQKSLVYTGSNFRLRKLVHDLILGKRAIKVGAIGGSITHGAKASVMGKTDWFSLVGTYMKAAFPRSQISFRNGALPATPSALMNMCLEQYVDDDVDLVFVEYVANDGANRFDEIKPKVYERLLRKLLNKKNKPAVVLVQLMPKGMAFGPGNRQKVPFHATLEDAYAAQAQYYDLPWLSFRNAVYRLAEFHVHGYNWTDFMWDKDFMHPIDSGMAVIADMVVYLFQQTALSLLLSPLSRADRELLHERLPPPMHQGNWEAKNLMCTYGEAFKPLADSAHSSGWDFINEGRPGAPKWGYISTTPGSKLKLVVNSLRQQGSQQQLPMNVMLAYLKSYVDMGMAKFECSSGCTCEPNMEVDALHSLRQSTIYLTRLLVSQAEQCEITITVLESTNSGKHKFKVSGIMMNEYIGDDITDKLHEEQWLTQLQATAHGGADRAASSGSSSSRNGGSSSSSFSSSHHSSNGTGQPDLPVTAPVPSLVQETSAAAKQTMASGGAAATQQKASTDPSDRRHHRRRLSTLISAVRSLLKL